MTKPDSLSLSCKISGMLLSIALGFGFVAAASADTASAAVIDRHVDYYYPTVTSREIYRSRTATLADNDRSRRVTFVTQFMAQAMSGSFAPGYAIFAKGEDAQKMIITATGTDRYATLYQMRALLAVLTAQARRSELFRQARVEDVFTFLDLLKLIGFQQLTVTNGVDFAHQFKIE